MMLKTRLRKRGFMDCRNDGYTVAELAALAGISVRTLHHYDACGLLKPSRRSNKYRTYGRAEVDRLQHILLYRELGFGLKAIREILDREGYDAETALLHHLEMLKEQQTRTDRLIAGVEKTLAEIKGETSMTDKEKFESFKKDLIAKNEQAYGKEIRERYGAETVEKSNAKLQDMTEAQWKDTDLLSARINELLLEAMEKGDPACAEAQEACDAHRQWICAYWPEGRYTKQAHKGLGDMYVADERFKAYYEKIADGAAEFLRDALAIYCAEEDQTR